MKSKNSIVNLTAKDLALLVGCWCRYKLVKNVSFTEGKLDFMILKLYEQGKITHLFPYLRSMSSLTDKERENCRRKQRVVRANGDNKVDFFLQVNARTTKYLLSKNIDVFGYIPRGLAIDVEYNSKNESNESKHD